MNTMRRRPSTPALTHRGRGPLCTLAFALLWAVGPAAAQPAAPTSAVASAATPAPATVTPLAGPLDAPTMQALLARIDGRQKNTGDFKAKAYIEQREKNKSDLVYDTVYYRHDQDDKFMILFLEPRTEAGKGYLRIEKNLWMYDPTVGKWERRTERERIGGTDSRRNDFDPDAYATDYTHTYVAQETLGRFTVHHLALAAKPGTDVAFPQLELWIDAATENVLKVQEKALSGRLMRTLYYPKWKRIFSESKQDHVYFPEEIRIFDEVEKGNRTTVLLRDVDLRALPTNIFTKAWLESKSR